jgi:hypothetical protein
MSPREQQQQMSDRWQLAFNSAAYALNSTALFLIAVSIMALERAYVYFEQKEYAWLVPGGMEKRV